MKQKNKTTTILAALSYLIDKQSLTPQQVQQLIVTTIEEQDHE